MAIQPSAEHGQSWQPSGSHDVDTIPRVALCQRLESPSLAPITLIVAPPGFGKSTLIAEWARETSREIHRLQMGPADNSVDEFAHHLLQSLGRSSVMEDLNDRASSADFGTVLIDELATGLEHLGQRCIVLDDYHLVGNRDVNELVGLVANNLPPRVHLMIASRTTPDLPLARLRANGQVRDLRMADLAFSADETEQLITRLLGPDRKTDSRDLQAQTEGWIVGIRLAILAIGRTKSVGILEPLTRQALDSGYIDEYLEQEVMSQLAPEQHRFVCESVFLPHLNPAICRQVLAIDRPESFIATVVRHQVFVVPTRHGDGQVRYHNLFATSIQRIAIRRLGSERIAAIQTNLGRWYEQQQQREEALECYIAAARWELAIPLLTTICNDMANQDLFHSLVHWLERIPTSIRDQHHALSYWYTFSLLALGHQRAGRECFQRALVHGLQSTNILERIRTLACQAMIDSLEGDANARLHLSQTVVALAPTNAWVERLHSMHGLLEHQYSIGDDEAAQATFQEMQEVRRHLPFIQRWWALHTQAEPANQMAFRGQLAAAWSAYQTLLDEQTSYLGHYMDKYRYRMAEIAVAQDDISEARRQLDILNRSDPPGRPYWYREALMTAARVARMEQNLPLAIDVVNEAIVHATRDGSHVDEVRARALLASLWLEAGDLDQAVRWLRTSNPDLEWARVFGGTNPLTVKVEVLIATARAQDAIDTCTAQIHDGLRRKRFAEVSHLYVLLALAQEMNEDFRQATASLDQAIGLAAPGNHVRAFWSPTSKALLPLLDRISNDPSLFIARIRQMHGRHMAVQGTSLSKRETEILELVATGLSNRDIAAHLFISEPTVKRHLANVNSKLGTSSRVQAVQRFRSTVSESNTRWH